MLSRFSLALITLLTITFTAFVWALVHLYSGALIAPADVDWALILVNLGASLICFLLLAVAAYLPVRKVIAAKLTIGFGLTFLGLWQHFLNGLITPTQPWLNLSIIALLPIGLGLATVGLYQLGRAYRSTRVRLTEYQHMKENLVSVDQLTQLYNRRHFFLAGSPMLSTALADGHQPVVAALRVTNLTMLNQALGFEAGDQVLVRVGKALQRCQQFDRLAARLGGRRFGLLLLNSSQQEAEALMREIAARLQHVVMTSDKGEEVLTSIELDSKIGMVQADESLATVLRRIGSSPDSEEAKLPGAN